MKNPGRYNTYANDTIGNCTIIPAAEPLHHIDPNPRRKQIGFTMRFASLYVTNVLSSGRKAVIMPGAQGGTGFTTTPQTWGIGKNLYVNALSRVKSLLAMHPQNRLVAILWLQGESDINRLTTTQYTQNVAQMIAHLRSSLSIPASAAPFIAGQIAYPQQQSNGGMQIQNGITALGKAVPNCAVVDNKDHWGSYLSTQDNLHYNAPAARILGEKFYNAFAGIV
ncbi:hypothetical protein HK104_005981, partial [Borealophlyctis nickersoniae]